MPTTTTTTTTTTITCARTHNKHTSSLGPRPARNAAQRRVRPQHCCARPTLLLRMLARPPQSGAALPCAELPVRGARPGPAALAFHPNAAAKVGGGVARIFVERRLTADGRHDICCFHVERADGTEDDFSLRKIYGRGNSNTFDARAGVLTKGKGGQGAGPWGRQKGAQKGAQKGGAGAPAAGARAGGHAPPPPSPPPPLAGPEDVDFCTVKELRAHLRRRGLPLSGNKPVLRARLAEAVRDGP